MILKQSIFPSTRITPQNNVYFPGPEYSQENIYFPVPEWPYKTMYIFLDQNDHPTKQCIFPWTRMILQNNVHIPVPELPHKTMFISRHHNYTAKQCIVPYTGMTQYKRMYIIHNTMFYAFFLHFTSQFLLPSQQMWRCLNQPQQP